MCFRAVHKNVTILRIPEIKTRIQHNLILRRHKNPSKVRHTRLQLNRHRVTYSHFIDIGAILTHLPQLDDTILDSFISLVKIRHVSLMLYLELFATYLHILSRFVRLPGRKSSAYDPCIHFGQYVEAP